MWCVGTLADAVSPTVNLGTQPKTIVVACAHSGSDQCKLNWNSTSLPSEQVPEIAFKMSRVNIVAVVNAQSKAQGKQRIGALGASLGDDLSRELQLNYETWVARTSIAPVQGSWEPAPNDQTSFFSKFSSRF